MAVALDLSLVLTSQQLYCDVELHGTLTKAQSVFDWHGTWGRMPNVHLVQKIKLQAFQQLMLRSLA